MDNALLILVLLLVAAAGARDTVRTRHIVNAKQRRRRTDHKEPTHG